MHERELKKEWTEVSQVTDSALAECLTKSRDRGREHRESERQVSDGESERQRAEFGVFVSSELKEGLIFSSNGAFCTFFFFFLILAWIGGFGRYGRFMPIWPSRLNSMRIGPSWSRVGASRLKKNKSHVACRGGTRPDARATASLARHRVERGCGTSSTVSVLHSFPLSWDVHIFSNTDAGQPKQN